MMKLRFSIRDLLWLTTMAALITAWWIDRTALSERVSDLATKYSDATKRSSRAENQLMQLNIALSNAEQKRTVIQQGGGPFRFAPLTRVRIE
jgi:hypothetical protein